MRKTILSLTLVMAALFLPHTSHAQSNWEIGVRFGDNFSIDATVPISAAPRLHPAIYFDRFGVGAYFDWMFALSGGPAWVLNSSSRVILISISPETLA